MSDRYDALGITPPDPGEVCDGYCEGTGYVPVYVAAGDHRGDDDGSAVRCASETAHELIAAWALAELQNPTDDGWHFVVCPTCKGTCIRPPAKFA